MSALAAIRHTVSHAWSSPAAARRPSRTPAEPPRTPPAAESGARRELSEAEIVELRRQIANGTYLTDEKLNVAADRLLARLQQETPRRT
jgi:hypothetical protein